MMAFQPLRKASATLRDQAVEAIKEYIIKHSLSPGDKLPSEQTLAKKLNVSRVVVREAQTTLAALGILEIKAGKGAYVRDLDFRFLADYLEFVFRAAHVDISELVEVRRLLEVFIVRQVIERISDSDMQKLRELVDQMGQKADRGEDSSYEDFQFHQVLSDIAGKRVLGLLISGFWEMLGQFQWERTRVILTEIYQGHLAILEAIEGRDAEKAVAAMEKHFDRLESRLTNQRSS